MRNMQAADAQVASSRRALAQLEDDARAAGSALGDVKTNAGQGMETARVLDSMKRSVSGVTAAAFEAADSLDRVKMSESAAVETRMRLDAIKDELDAVILRSELARRALGRVNGGGGVGGRGGGGGDGFLAGLLPGGQRASAGAVTAGIGIAAGLAPAILPAGVGAMMAFPQMLIGAAGAFGVVKLALADLNSQAFSTQKAFNELNASQQGLVQDLRSLDAGLIAHLEATAQATLIPAFHKDLHQLATPGMASMLQSGTQAFSGAVAQSTGDVSKYLGSSAFTSQFGDLLQRNAGYLSNFGSTFNHVVDALLRFLNAGKPFTDWVDQTIRHGAVWLDTWSRMEQQTGGFTRASEAAIHAFQNIGDVLMSAGGFLVAFYNDLGGGAPAMTLVTGLLDELTKLLRDNQDVFTRFFEGASQSINDLLTLIDLVLKGVHPLLAELDKLASAIGGWRVVIDAVAIAFAVRFAAMKLGVTGYIASLLGIGPAAGRMEAQVLAALASIDAQIAETTALLREMMLAEQGIGAAAVEGAVGAEAAIGGVGAAASASAGEVAVLEGELAGLAAAAPIVIPITLAVAGAFGLDKLMQWAGQGMSHGFSGPGGGGGNGGPDAAGNQPGDFEWWAIKAAQISKKHKGDAQYWSNHPDAAVAVLKAHHVSLTPPGTGSHGGSPAGTGSDALSNLVPSAGVSGAMFGASAPPPAAPFDIFGNPTALDQTGMPKAKKPKAPPTGFNILPQDLQQRLALAQGNDAYSTLQTARALKQTDLAAEAYLEHLRASGVSQKEISAIDRELTSLKREQAGAQREINKALKAQHQAEVSAHISAILGISNGGVPGTRALQTRERHVLLAELKRSGLLTDATAHESIGAMVKTLSSHGDLSPVQVKDFQKITEAINLAKREHVKLAPDQVSEITSLLSQINDTLKTNLGYKTNYRAPSAEKLAEAIPGYAAMSHGQKVALIAAMAAKVGHHGTLPTGGAVGGVPLDAHDQSLALHPQHGHGGNSFFGNVQIVIQGADKNVKELAREIRHELLKTARRNPTQTIGPQAGRSIGLN